LQESYEASLTELASSDEWTKEQKLAIFEMLISKEKEPTEKPPPSPAYSDEGVVAQPSTDQEMLDPLPSESAVDAAQMLKNRAEARAFEASHTATPVLGSAMEKAVRGLSSSGSLPPNSSAAPQVSSPPPPLACLLASRFGIS
jgi:hypothetical protein